MADGTTDVAAMLLAMNNKGGDFASGVALGASFNNNDRDGHWHNPPEQNQANMSLMQSIGAVDKSVAVAATAMEASQAVQSAGIVSQLNNVAGSLSARVDGVKETVNAMAMVLANQISGVDRSVMESRYEVSKDITADGDKTRALITSNYQDTLNRQLTEANAALIELRSEDRSNRRAFDNQLTVTQTVNQAQTQTQTNAHFDRLYHMLHGVTQNIRDTNTAINFGAGTLTASPVNTNTNNNAGL